jgi:hypothetical protein
MKNPFFVNVATQRFFGFSLILWLILLQACNTTSSESVTFEEILPNSTWYGYFQAKDNLGNVVSDGYITAVFAENTVERYTWAERCENDFEDPNVSDYLILDDDSIRFQNPINFRLIVQFNASFLTEDRFIMVSEDRFPEITYYFATKCDGITSDL